MRSIRWASLLFACVAVISNAAWAEEDAQKAARRHLDGLRGVQVTKGKAALNALNKKMDDAWTFIKGHPEGIALVQEELAKAITAPKPDQFFLLDMAYLSVDTLGAKALEPATAALERIDPASGIIQANKEELFHFIMKMGELGASSGQYLAQLDRIYLQHEESLDYFKAPHVVRFVPFDVRCMVYGACGSAAADHLAALLPASKSPARILQVLSAIGSEANVPGAKAAMKAGADYDVISAGLTFMMQLGGPSGREAVLALDQAKFSGKARAFLAQTRPAVEAVNFDAFVATLTKLDPKSVSDEKLQTLLDKMEANDGADDETPPAAMVKSGLATDALLTQLKRIRARSFRRQNNHVLEELPITNMVINALQFKPR
jgi:hypothetical protein